MKRIKGKILKPFTRGKLRKLSLKPPVLIGGCGRSGTTLLLSILGAHPSLYAIPHESRLFCRWIEAEDRKQLPANYWRFYWYLMLYKIKPTATRYIEKTPRNVRFIKKILNYLGPDARFIHIIRDGRDVLTSKHPRRPEKYWIPVKRWVNDVQAGLDFADNPQVLTLKYEDLVIDTKNKICEICEFLDEPVTDEILNWHQHSNVKKSGAWHHAVQQTHTDSVKKWEKPEFADRIARIMSNDDAVALLKKLDYI